MILPRQLFIGSLGNWQTTAKIANDCTFIQYWMLID